MTDSVNVVDVVEASNINDQKAEKMQQGLKKDVAKFTMLNAGDLMVSEYNVRKSAEDAKHDETNINTLTANISQYGLLNPLTVCVSKQHPDKFEILAGQRRFKALQALNWTEIPCRIVECNSYEQAALIGLAENMQRLPMSIRDKCQTIQKLYDIHKEDLDAVVRLTNLSQITVKRYLNLSQNLAASLHDRFEDKEEGKLTLGVANLLTQVVPDVKKQEEVYEAIKDLSTNGQKQEVLSSLAEDPDADLGELVNEVRERDTTRKRHAKIKKGPWTFDQQSQPLAIPKNLYGPVLQLLASHGIKPVEDDGATANSGPAKKRAKKARKNDDE